MDGIIDLKKQRFIRDCKEYLKTGSITNELSMAISYQSPGNLEYLKKDLDDSTLKVVNTAIKQIQDSIRKYKINHRQKINVICQSVLENLSTFDERFKIKEVIERYRETINPVKALYYDLQEIMFLYDGKTKNDHHRYLISKFSKIEDFENILLAVEKDIEDLHQCKIRVKDLRDQFSINSNSEYSVKVTDLHNEMIQWKKLFKRFPDWVSENKDDGNKGLISTLRDFFHLDD